MHSLYDGLDREMMSFSYLWLYVILFEDSHDRRKSEMVCMYSFADVKGVVASATTC